MVLDQIVFPNHNFLGLMYRKKMFHMLNHVFLARIVNFVNKTKEVININIASPKRLSVHRGFLKLSKISSMTPWIEENNACKFKGGRA